jgi:DNA ligase-1
MTLLARLVEVSDRVAVSSARLTKVRELAEFLRFLEPVELQVGVQYLSGEIPQGRSGIGSAALREAGNSAPASEASLNLLEVDRSLSEIAAMRGTGVNARRATALRDLFMRATITEGQFLTRLLLGDLRQGALAGVMIDAIAAAADLPVSAVRRAMMYAPGIGAVAQAALLDGSAGLASYQLATLSPIAPMLAQTAADPADALRQLGGEAAFEWKMDGARIQVHKADTTVCIYTRNLNEVGAAIPEIVEFVRTLSARELILDGEALAFDASNRPHPFQVTMRRFGRNPVSEARLAETHQPVVEPRPGRRTTRSLPLFPPPQKNRSAPSDSSPETPAPVGISSRSRTFPVFGSMRLRSLSSPSQVPCQSSPSTQVTPVTKRLDSIVRSIAPVCGSI